MDEAERLRELADDVDELVVPVERELSSQLENGDFAGRLADEAEGIVQTMSQRLSSLAENLRIIADERDEED
ncbi:hypothetical protein [Phytoactinopolyspora mesophila]|uniref:Uncharacterized protein n=1 Tax=Phytoactinopolyspora mesophila TaxID=2650750 RepID=A0A7K3MBY6_9ACTN|nr:hypothetical protein [Phytoactinopolyspora mesophila]NDL59908.1 hypothetical protein [Phytoactinopolyspora mesophila]